MNWLAKVSVRRPTFATVLMALVVVFGTQFGFLQQQLQVERHATGIKLSHAHSQTGRIP